MKFEINITKKQLYYVLGFVVFVFIIGIAIAQSSAPNPGHAAAEIGEGTIANTLTITAGNIGIGTASPGSKLDVSGGVIRALATTAPAAGSGIGMEMFFDSNGPEGRLASIDRAGAGTYKPIRFGASNYQFDVSAAAKMVLDANGNVGIGTTDPGTRLHISAGARGADVTGMRISTDSGTGIAEDRLFADFRMRTGTPNTQLAGRIGAVVLDPAAFSAGLVFHTTDGGRDDERMRITNTGNVGIGTTSPSDKLSVNGDISATGNIKLACTRVTAQCTLPATAGGYCSATATCPSGYYIVSGGWQVNKCGHGDEYEVEQSYPLSSTQWFADFSNTGTCTVDRVQTTYAVCCKTASY